MLARDLEELVSYSAWATRRTLDAARGVPSALLGKELPGSFPTLLETLTHVYAVDRLWLGRSEGVRHAYPPAGAFRDLPSLAAAWLALCERWLATAATWCDA